MNFSPASQTLQPGTVRYTTQALRCLIDGFKTDDTTRDFADAATVLSRLEEQLALPETTPTEPPIADWDAVPEPSTPAQVLQQLRDRIDDSAYGYPDWDAAQVLLDQLEDFMGWPHSYATVPQVELDVDGHEL